MSLQSPAERHLIAELSERLPETQPPARILNVGANVSVVIERALAKRGIPFVVDRTDVIPCDISPEWPWKGRVFQESVEAMPSVPAGAYRAAFANFVLEHVGDLGRAAAELARVLEPGGTFVASIPNPRAPEFQISRFTPHRFHVFVRGDAGHDVHETRYAYSSLRQFRETFERAGFETVAVHRNAATYVYLHRFPVVAWVSRAYDRVVEAIGVERLLGAACFVFRKR